MFERHRQHRVEGERLNAQQLVASIGTALLRIVHEGAYADAPLSEVVLYAPGAPEPVGAQSIVLALGVTTADELSALLRTLDAAGAGVVVVKAPLPGGVELGRATIIEVAAEASWMHVATTIREQFVDFARASIRSDGLQHELFAIANAIYTEFDVPVTIEDRFSALVAWSAGQERSDPERIDTILGRAVDQATLLEQRRRGEFELLHAAEEPVFIPAQSEDTLARVAMAVRAGAEILGYVWAAVSGPFTPAETARLKEFAPSIALRLASMRTESNYARKQRGELAAAVLSGSASHVEASRLQLGAGPYCILAAAPRLPDLNERTAEFDAAMVADLQRFAETLDYFLTAVHPGAVSVVGKGAVYVIVGGLPGVDDARAAAADLARRFLSRTPFTQRFTVAVSGAADVLGDIPRYRSQADASLRALQHPGDRGAAVRTVDEAALSVMLLHLSDVIDSLGLPVFTGALAELETHEGAGGLLAESLAAYLDASGAIDLAAQRLHVHPNTLRYRLRRIRELSGLSFADADAVLLAQLQLRVSALRADVGVPMSASEGRSSGGGV